MKTEKRKLLKWTFDEEVTLWYAVVADRILYEITVSELGYFYVKICDPARHPSDIKQGPFSSIGKAKKNCDTNEIRISIAAGKYDSEVVTDAVVDAVLTELERCKSDDSKQAEPCDVGDRWDGLG